MIFYIFVLVLINSFDVHKVLRFRKNSLDLKLETKKFEGFPRELHERLFIRFCQNESLRTRFQDLCEDRFSSKGFVKVLCM